jgi:hypothetical protein
MNIEHFKKRLLDKERELQAEIAGLEADARDSKNPLHRKRSSRCRML